MMYEIKAGQPVNMLSSLQLEFMNQLEKTEAKAYDIFGQCNYWVKRYTQGKLIIECDDRIMKEL